MKIKTFKYNHWYDFAFQLDTTNLQHMGTLGIITTSKISLALNTFKENIISKIDFSDNNKLIIIFKIKTKNNLYRNISRMQIINIDNFNELNKIFIEF